MSPSFNLPQIRTKSIYVLLLTLIFIIYLISPLSPPLPSRSTKGINSISSSLNYRNHLLSNSLNTSIHSNTLTFTSIYVLSLPSRIDRRQEMLKLGDALGLSFKFVDAFDKNGNWVKWIAERVKEVREIKRGEMARAQNKSPESIGGLRINSDWLSTTSDLEGLYSIDINLLDSSTLEGQKNWVDYLEFKFDKGELNDLVPREENKDMDVGEYLWDQKEKAKGRQLNEGVISTYFGHTRVMKEMIKNGDESALILEDDVDIEWDLEMLWNPIAGKLPLDWEVVYLGHCWGRELLRPAYLHPLLHQSTAPMCLHAYAVSALGAKSLLHHLFDPFTAYQAPIDTSIPTLISKSKINSFSVEPPLIIQRKDSPSDIRERAGSRWKGLLRDSTVERIKMDEGVKIVEDENGNLDPANIFRYKVGCHKD